MWPALALQGFFSGPTQPANSFLPERSLSFFPWGVNSKTNTRIHDDKHVSIKQHFNLRTPLDPGTKHLDTLKPPSLEGSNQSEEMSGSSGAPEVEVVVPRISDIRRAAEAQSRASSSSSSSSSANPDDNDASAAAAAAPQRNPYPQASVTYAPINNHAVRQWWAQNPSYWTTIPWHRMPKPSALSPLWGWSMITHQKLVLHLLCLYSDGAGRRLDDEERDTLVEAFSRCAVMMSYERPIGLGVSAWFLHRSWHNSGMHEAGRRAAEREAAAAAAAAASSLGKGVVGGHITHFSRAPPPPPPASSSISRAVAGLGFGNGGGFKFEAASLFRRSIRLSLVGLSCAIGWELLHQQFEDIAMSELHVNIAGNWRLMQLHDDVWGPQAATDHDEDF